MSSLQQQLASLAGQSTRVAELRKASILFDAVEVQKVSTQTVYSIGLNGFLDLVRTNEQFAPFEKTLFSKSSVQFNRQLQTKEENRQLDTAIASFLALLSPYLLLKSAQKAFEYLLRRYHVQVYNVDAVMACALPFHATHLFSRILRTLQLDKTRWEFLKNVQKESDEGVSRTMIVSQCLKDHGLLNFIADHCRTTVERYENFSTALVFYSVVVLEAIETLKTPQEKFVTTLLPHLMFGIQYSKRTSLQTATYMIVSLLASKTAFSSVLTESLLLHVLHNAATLPVDSLTLLIHLCQTQRIARFPAAFLRDVVQLDGLVDHLNELSAQYDCTSFLQLLVEGLLATWNESAAQQLLIALITTSRDLASVAQRITSDALDLFLSSDSSAEQKTWAQRVLGLVETRYSAPFNRALTERFEAIDQLSQENQKEAQGLLLALANMRVQDIRHRPLVESGTTLYFSLKHVNPSVRLQALEVLVSEYRGASQLDEDARQRLISFYEQTLLDLLHDDHPPLISAVLDAPDLLQRVDGALLLDKLTHLFDQGINQGEVLPLLCRGHFQQDEALHTRVLQFLTTRALYGPNRTSSVQGALLKALEKLHPTLFKGLSKVRVKEDSPAAREQANDAVMQQIQKNLQAKSSLAAELLTLLQDDAVVSHDVSCLLLAVLLPYAPVETTLEAGRLLVTRLAAFYERSHYKTFESASELPAVLRAFSNGKPAQAAQRTASFALLSLIRSMPHDQEGFPMEEIMTLRPSPESHETASDLTLRTLDILLAVPSPALLAPYLQALVASQPGFHLFRFLSVFWMDQSQPTPLSDAKQVRALNLCNVLLHSWASYQPQVYQTLFPTLAIALLHPTLAVRHATLACLCTLRQLLGGKGKKAFRSTFYGAKNDKSLHKVDAKAFLALVELFSQNAQALMVDAHVIVHRMAEFLQTTPTASSLLTYLLSHAQAATHPAITSGILTLLREYTSAEKLSQSHTLLDGYVSANAPHAHRFGMSKPHYQMAFLRCTQELVAMYQPTLTAEVLNDEGVYRTLDQAIRSLVVFEVHTVGHEQTVYLSRLALQQIDRALFVLLSEEHKSRLFSTLCACLRVRIPVIRDKARQIIQEVELSSDLVAEQLMRVLPESQSSPAKKRAKRRSTSITTEEDIDEGHKLDSIALILELLQAKKNHRAPRVLIPKLFQLLTCLSDRGHALGSQVNSEYVTQLVLTTLRNIVNHYASRVDDKQQAAKLAKMASTFRVGKIIKCIQGSPSPQTQNKAFLLLSAMTRIFPDDVLKYSMPIFTLMGDTSLRSDDNYTFQVLHKTIQSIIPRIAEKQKSQVIPIIKVLVDDFQFIPSHRRLVLFSSFVKSFGVQYFHVVFMFLFQLHTAQHSFLEEGWDNDDTDHIPKFCMDLVLQFSPLQALPALARIIQSLTAYKNNPKESMVVRHIAESATSSSGKPFDYYNLAGMACQFVHKYLDSAAFYKQVLTLSPEANEQMQQALVAVFESLMFLLRLVSSLHYQVGSQEATQCKAIIEQVYAIVEQLNELLEIDAFVNFISDLIHHYDPQIRRRSLLLLNEKIEEYEGDFDAYDVAKFTELVSKVGELIRASPDVQMKDESDEDATEGGESSVNQQTALYSLEILARHFGAQMPDAFLEILPAVMECLDSTDEQIQASAVICVATNCISVGVNVLAHLPTFFPKILAILAGSVQSEATTPEESRLLLTMSTLSALEVCLRHLPSFLSSYLSDMLLLLLRGSLLQHSHTQVIDKVQLLLGLVSEKIKTRKIVSALIEVFQAMESSEEHTAASYRQLFQVLGAVCKQITNAKISQYYAPIVKFFMSAFDLRVKLQDKWPLKKTRGVEEAMIDAFINFILKLNEILFKPVFLKLRDWSQIPTQPYAANRKAFFYKLVNRLATSLNVVLVPMFAYLLDDMMALLQNPKSLLQSEDEEMHTFQGAPEALVTEAMQEAIHALGQCFEYNESKFVTKERFEMVVGPLVRTLEYHKHPYLDYDVIVPSLVFCLGQLAATVRNQLLWKPLQNQVLMQTRHDSAKVRYAALLVIQEFYRQLGEEFLPMLPESIPFIAELIEDSNEEVERLCQEIIAQVDEFLGDEKIEDYL